MGVAVGVGPVCAQYFPPLLRKTTPPPYPPHTIISLPVQIAGRYVRPAGTLAMLVAVQVSVPGLYLPPVFNKYWLPLPSTKYPPHPTISPPVQMAVWLNRPSGTLLVLVAVQVSVPGLYLPPVFK